MIGNELSVEDWDEPERDRRGRFRKGSSGNPLGRPPKRPDPGWSVEEAFARALAEEVPVSGPAGSQRKMALRELLVKSAVRDALKANAKEKMYIIERLTKLQFLKPSAQEEEEDEIFTEEHRRIMESIERDVLPHICCQCEKPVMKGIEPPPTRADFAFE